MVDEDWPEVHPDLRTLGDAEMLMAGGYGDTSGFGSTVPLPSAIASLAQEHGGVVLVDDESAPVAAVATDGSLRRIGHPGSGSFRSLYRAPATVSSPTPRIGVLLDRPLLAPEVSALAEFGEDASLLLLARTVDPQVPAEVLIKATMAAAGQLPSALVVAVPFGRRDDTEADAALARVVLHSYGAEAVDVLEDDAAWQDVREALDHGDDAALSSLLDPASLTALRRWRPPRSERGLVVFFTGLSGSGKSTVARGLIDRLHETDRSVTVLDGDVARRMLSSGLGFGRDDRDTNIRRLGWVGAEVARHGGVAVLAPIAPFAATRAEVRERVEATGDLVLVWVSTPLEECERRDRKGLYAKARRGEIPDFTGISSPYEEPDDADVVVDTTGLSPGAAVARVWDHLVDGGWVRAPSG